MIAHLAKVKTDEIDAEDYSIPSRPRMQSSDDVKNVSGCIPEGYGECSQMSVTDVTDYSH